MKESSTGENTCNASCNLYFPNNIIYDSVLAVILADSNDSLNLSFVGCSGLVKFRNGRRLNNNYQFCSSYQ